MVRKIKGTKAIVFMMILMFVSGVMAFVSNSVRADAHTIHVKNAQEFAEALANDEYYSIVIDESFDVPCKTASDANGTSFFYCEKKS